MQPNLCLLLPTILKFYSLPPLLVSNSSCLFIQCQFLYANNSTVLPYFPKYCTIRLKCFIFVFKISVDRRRDKDVVHTYRATFGSVLSRVRLFETLWTAAHQASLPITNTWSTSASVLSMNACFSSQLNFLVSKCKILYLYDGFTLWSLLNFL